MRLIRLKSPAASGNLKLVEGEPRRPGPGKSLSDSVTAWSRLVTHGRVKPGDTVLVLGSGGVPLFTLQFTKMAGARVIATSSSEDKPARLQRLGADENINYKKYPAWGQKAKALTNRGGVDQRCSILEHANERTRTMKNSTFATAWRVRRKFRITLNPVLFSLFLAFGFALSSAISAQEVGTELDRMPADLETQFALSALPKALRDQASVYLLDPEKGYELSQEGSSDVTCLVERTVWEMADFRNDIYIPLCYDAAGTETYLKVKMDAAALRAEGMDPDELHAEIEGRFRNGTYRAPERAGVSYMVAPLQRTNGPPDMKVHTLSLPHYMPYAPNVTNEDIGATPDLADPASLYRPFIDRQGIDEQSYLVLFVSQMERDQILADEQELLEGLCAYRDVLCDPQTID